MENPYWPLFGLRITTPRLELRYPDDELLVRLVETARRGIHDPAVMPFSFPWTDVASPEFERNCFRHWWRIRAEHAPDDWHLELAVLLDGEPIGAQMVRAHQFAVTREVSTGSWLGLAHQGRGYGKEMRAAVLHLAFEGLGARTACSGAFTDNPASRKVSASLGYEPDGVDVKVRRGEPATIQRLRLSRERWEQHRPSVPIEVHGLDACRDWLGVDG